MQLLKVTYKYYYEASCIIQGTLNDFKLLSFTPNDPYGKKEFQPELTGIVDRTTFTTTQRHVF